MYTYYGDNMEETILENLKKNTDKEISYPVKGSLKMVNAGKLKLLGQNLPTYLGITEDSIILSIFNKKDLKNELFNTEMYFSEIKNIQIKEASLTKEKIIEINGTDKAYFKFSLSKLNNEETLTNFLEKLSN